MLDKRIRSALRALQEILTNRSVSKDDPFCVIKLWSEYSRQTVRKNITNIIMLKIARIDSNISVEDSWLDIAGYAILAYALEMGKNGSTVHKPEMQDNPS